MCYGFHSLCERDIIVCVYVGIVKVPHGSHELKPDKVEKTMMTNGCIREHKEIPDAWRRQRGCVYRFLRLLWFYVENNIFDANSLKWRNKIEKLKQEK